jgi:hypothetical protein
MGKLRWYKRDPDAALAGMMVLTLEERGAYNTVLDLIYARDGAVDDDPRFIAGWLRCDVRVWKRIRDRLIALEKIYVEDGTLRNCRADAEVNRGLQRIASASEAGKASARSRTDVNRENNDLPPTSVERPFQLPTTTSTKREEERKIKPASAGEDVSRETSPPPESPAGLPTKYVFDGAVVKLKQKNFDEWTRAYPDLNLQGELLARDAWLANAPEGDRKNWFISTSKYLANRNMEARAKSKSFKWRSGIEGVV